MSLYSMSNLICLTALKLAYSGIAMFGCPKRSVAGIPSRFLALSFVLACSVALTQSASAQSDQEMYTDSLQNGWQNWSWATVDFNHSTTVHSGGQAVSVDAVNYQAVSFWHSAQDASPFIDFSFWIHGGTAGGQVLQVYAETSGGGQPAVGIPAPIAGTWQLVTVSLDSLGVGGAADLTRFNIQSLSGGSQPTFYVDDVRLKSDTTPPVVESISPPAGTVSALTSVVVTFSEPVTGVDAADVRLNGSPATGVSGGSQVYTFTFVEPAEGVINVTWASGHGIADIGSANPFIRTGPGATWQYTLVDSVPPAVSLLFPGAGAKVASFGQIEVTFSETVLGVDASDLLINGSPAATVTKLSGQPYVFQFSQPATGLVSVAWAPGHAITDDAAAPNAFASGAWSYTLDPSLPLPDLVINEILCSNVDTNGLTDEDGQLQDWIEIYNRGTQPVDLTNWSLSDDPAIPGLWPFPARTLAPGQFLVVFASGKDRKPASGELHANFKLAISGEPLGLYSPDSPRQLASGFDPFAEQRNDVSFGPELLGELRYFATPTPGGPNGTSTIVGVVERVHANVERGHFNAPFTLMLSTPTSGATLRYTTDGSEPTVSSPVFPASLTVSDTTLLRAAGFKANHLPSRTLTHSYLFNMPESIRSLPVLSIVTDSNHLWGPTGIMGIQGGYHDGGNNGLWISTDPSDYHNPEEHGLAWEKPTSAEWINPEDHSGFQVDCGIRIQGSDYNRDRARIGGKYSFRLYFRGDYGPGRLQYPLFPLTGVDRFDTLVLRAGFNEQENPFIRDEIHRRLSHDMGQIASHGNMAVVFINGDYWDNVDEPWKSPVYNPCERIDKEFMQEHLGGGENWDVVKPPWQGDAVDGDFVEFNSLLNYINGNNAANSSVYTEIGTRMDLTNYADYLMLNTFAAMGDWPGNNWRAGREQGPNGIWRWVMWDSEWGMGIYDRWVDINSFTGLDAEIGQIYDRLTASEEFQMLWADRVQKHFYNGGVLTPEHITNRFEQLEAELSELIPNMDTEILDWADQREPIYFSQMSAEGLLAPIQAPTFGQHGGRVPVGFDLTMTAPSGTIYYTTDGSDPRVKFTGAISGSAASYPGGAGVAINSTVTVKARARQNSSTWSALTEATFEYAALGTPLRITEVMYNPVDGSLYEFVELENTSSTSVDLSGMYFGGITFTFLEGTTLEAGTRLVLGSNTATNSWKTRYPGVTAAGWFAGNLSNGGERIELFDADGTLITSVDYGDGGGWPEAADGAGRSLEVIDANGDPDDPGNWQASAAADGTPGASNSAPPAQPVCLNEVLAENLTALNHSGTYPDYVELRNAGGSAVNIGGWSLTDSGNERKYVFPGGTTVPGSGYLVIWCDSATNTTPGLHSDFSLDNDGETLSLFDDNTNRIDAMSFGLQIADYSVGRISDEWTLNNPTSDAVNSAASMATASSLTLNEWMADPLPGKDDWFELYNSSATLPASLQGIYLATSNNLHQLNALSFVAPLGHVQLRADNGVGPDHLDFSLSAAGDQIVLYDNTGGLIEQISFALQTENVSEGRLPDGNASISSFPGTASPAAANYTSTYGGPVINELLARNQTVDVSGNTVDYIEIHNGGGSFDLSGMSLSVNSQEPGEWTFPPGTTLGANAFLVIKCDGSAALSTNAGSFNTGESLDGESGGAYLFSAAGQLVNSVQYGLQIRDRSIGLSSGQWRLLTSATPGTANVSIAALGSTASLHLNEWMADEAGGADWFEIYNPSSQPVDLCGISLSDDPSIVGVSKFLPAALSFVAANGFVKWVADASAGQGRNHVNFALNDQGDSILVYRISGPDFIPVDSVAFGAQSNGVSAGSIPDGTATVETFPGSPSPAASNYRLLTGVVVNEILTHTDPPFEDAIELHNPTGTPLDVGGWYLSNNEDNFTKYQIPGGTTIPAGGYAAFYEDQFNDGSTNAFALNSAHGDDVWLSEAPGGIETYDRMVVPVGAAFNGVPFGPVTTSVGLDYAPLLNPTFGVNNPTSLAQFRTGTGAANADPIVGPVILNEILYNPVGGTNGTDEYIELHNNSGTAVLLYDAAHPTNHWKLGGGLSFSFPAGASITAGGYLLVVEFDPVADPAALSAFRSLYGINTNVPVHGPFSGNLNNDADDVDLYQPDTPQSGPPDEGFVPYVRVDRVDYTDDAPWPSGLVDGGGLSLQRTAPNLYGNEPLNWFEALPTPGSSNDLLLTDTDGDGIPDADELAMGLNPNNTADGAWDNDLDGLTNYEEWAAGTDLEDPNSNLKLAGSAAAPNIVLTFDAVSNKTYSVLYTDDLGNPSWLKLADVPALPSNQPVSLTNTMNGSITRLYQVVTPAQP